jgi:succinate dehydrogenase / fumarate reductase membrane anchor subunit
MRDRALWTWHIASGLVVLAVLGLHMAVMHLDATLGVFNPAGGHPIDWDNVAARARDLGFAASYVVLLAAALFHGLYGFRTIVFELGIGATARRSVSLALILTGSGLFILGAWAAWASLRLASGA